MSFQTKPTVVKEIQNYFKMFNIKNLEMCYTIWTKQHEKNNFHLYTHPLQEKKVYIKYF